MEKEAEKEKELTFSALFIKIHIKLLNFSLNLWRIDLLNY